MDVASAGAAALDRVLQHVGDEPLAPARSVVGADEELVRRGAEPVLEDEEVPAAGAQDRHDLVPGLAEGARDGEHRRRADPARDARDGSAEVLGLAGNADVRRVPERTGDVREGVAFVERLGHLDRGLADGLDDEGDRSGPPVHVRDRQRDPLGAARADAP